MERVVEREREWVAHVDVLLYGLRRARIDEGEAGESAGEDDREGESEGLILRVTVG